MSGVENDDVDVELKDKELVIRGTRREQDVPKGYTPLYRERGPFRYERTFVLGDDVDGERISAVYENGVLSLKLPKAQKPQPKKIAVA